MKHIYALFALLITSFVSWGQTITEDFETQTALTSSYANGSFIGADGVTFTYVHSRNEALGTSDDSSIDGKGIMLRRADEPSSIEFTLPNGVSNLSFEYRKAFTGGSNNRQLAVFVNGVQEYVTPMFGTSGTDTTVHTFNENIDEAGAVTIKITYPTGTANGNKQITIDNISWTEPLSSCEASNLAFTNTTVNKDLLDPSFTQTATSLNATTAITYESSDELVATVNTTTGEVALVGVGTATITATQEAGEHSGVDYCAGTATYDVVVTTSIPVLTVSANSASFSGFAGGAAATEDITVEGFNLTGDITLVLSGDANFSINPASLSSTGGEVTITYTPSATPATHNATLTVSNGALSEVITLSGVTDEMPEAPAVCGLEDFTNAINLPTGSSYGGGTFTGNNDIVWNYHGQSAGDYEIDGNGFLLRRASDSYLEVTIPDGVGEFSFDYRKAYTGNSSRQLELLINGVQVATSPTFGETPTGADATVYTFTHTVNVEGEVTVRIKLTGSATTNRHTTIDNISWTCYSAEEPIPTPTASFELEDLHIEHNINATTPTVAEAIVNIANLTEEFNLSVVSTTEYFVVNTTGALVNGENTIQIQLADGLAAGEYTGSIIVSLGEEILATLPLTGEVVDIPLSTPENAIEGLRIYPNPATDVVFVTSNSGAMKNVQLFDLSGKKVLDVHTTSSFQVNALANGIYVMKVTEEGKTSTSKLIVK